MQLAGEPGHPFVWQLSGAVTDGWLPFLTNPAEPLYWSGPEILTVTNLTVLSAGFLRVQMGQ